jgi:hypothetical protein
MKFPQQAGVRGFLSGVAEDRHRTLELTVSLYVRLGSAGRIVATPASST